MKITIVVYGSRGDVQPMLALANGLIKKGHEVMLCANPENEELAIHYDCPFTPFGPNVREQMTINAASKKSPDSFSSVKGLKREIEKQIELLPEIIEGSDLVLGCGIVFGDSSAAEIAKVPYRLIVLSPASLGPGKNASITDRMKFSFGLSMLNLVLKGTINKKRKKAGIKPINNVIKHFGGDNIIVASEVALNSVQDGVDAIHTQTGYIFLPAQNDLPKEVEDFIADGEPPGFIGFGSNPISNPEELAITLEKISTDTNQRFIISKGWTEFTITNSSSDIIYVEDIPHELLFPKIAFVIHHGGSGTMTSAARAGIPQAAFPFMFDQFENRNTIVRLGLGPKSCDYKRLNADVLISVIDECANNKRYKKNALDIAHKLQNSNGLELTIEEIEKNYSFNQGDL